MPPILCAAVEVEPDEQQIDLEEVGLGIRARLVGHWRPTVQRHPRPKLHVQMVPELCEEQTASEEILHAAANAIAIAIDGGCGKGSGTGDSG